MNFNITGKLTNSGGGAVVPVGTVLDFAGTNPPQYYLLCNGQEVSRTDYAELFDVIGTTWGAGMTQQHLMYQIHKAECQWVLEPILTQMDIVVLGC